MVIAYKKGDRHSEIHLIPCPTAYLYGKESL